MPVRDSGALADALNRLLCDADLRHRLGEAGRERYVREFSAGRMTQRTLQLYRRLLPVSAL